MANKKQVEFDLKLKRNIDEWVGLCGSLGFMSVIMLLISQSLLWVKVGEWTSYPLSYVVEKYNLSFFDYSKLSYIGIQKILTYVFDLPIHIFIFTLGIILGWLIGSSINLILISKNGIISRFNK